jgi:hypothetical protein
MIRSFATILSLVALASPALGQAQNSLVGTWELTYVAPQGIENTMPGGVTNTKMYFTSDGRLFALRPESTSLQEATSTTYAFDGKILKVTVPGGRTRIIGVSFTDQETMVFKQQFESQRTFKKISSYEKRLEPKSLQLVVDNSNYRPTIIYDTKDQSGLSEPERIKGVWEVIALENVPQNQAPPYGYFNDLWTIDAQKVSITRRNPPAFDSVPCSLEKGHLSSSGLSLGGPAGSKVDWTFNFNEWGHLVLESSYCRVVLKLVSKSTESVPSVPLKVVLLKVN